MTKENMKQYEDFISGDVYESKEAVKSPVAVGFNSDMFAVDFLRGEE